MSTNEKVVDWALLYITPERMSLSKLNVLYGLPLLFGPQKIVYFILGINLDLNTLMISVYKSGRILKIIIETLKSRLSNIYELI